MSRAEKSVILAATLLRLELVRRMDSGAQRHQLSAAEALLVEMVEKLLRTAADPGSADLTPAEQVERAIGELVKRNEKTSRLASVPPQPKDG